MVGNSNVGSQQKITISKKKIMNNFNIDYSVYTDCEILAIYKSVLKVQILSTKNYWYINKNYVLYNTPFSVGDIVRVNKNYLSIY